MKNGCVNLNICSFGFGVGLTWAIGILVLGLVAWGYGWGDNMVNTIGELYLGYAPTLLGSVIGAIWGFVMAFIAGALIAYFNNMCLRKCCSYSHKKEADTSP